MLTWLANMGLAGSGVTGVADNFEDRFRDGTYRRRLSWSFCIALLLLV